MSMSEASPKKYFYVDELFKALGVYKKGMTA